MADKDKREVWQRGPVPGVPGLLQPVAHALLQASEEVEEMMTGFNDERLWDRPAGVASPAFNLRHLEGVLNRLLTYAREESLTEEQLSFLAAEGKKAEISTTTLVENFGQQVIKAVEQLKNTSEHELTAPRTIGRALIPTTLIGLLVHTAEHTMRHTGQLLVTVKVIQASNSLKSSSL